MVKSSGEPELSCLSSFCVHNGAPISETLTFLRFELVLEIRNWGLEEWIEGDET